MSLIKVKKFWFTCGSCGDRFYVRGTHTVPGVNGYVFDSNDEQYIFVDPTRYKKCPNCIIKEVNND